MFLFLRSFLKDLRFKLRASNGLVRAQGLVFLTQLLIGFGIVGFGKSSVLWAQTSIDGMSIQANSGERDLKNQSMELKGNVQIIFKGQHLRADRAVIYQGRKVFEAEGRVLFVTPQTTLAGNKIEMNYETNVGRIYGGYVQSGQILLEGDVIEKSGEDEYRALQSQFTSCTTCPPAWSFKGQSVEAQMGGYATLKNTLFYFGKVPVMWFPYLIVPLKSERQTGLLTPSLEFYGKGRFSFLQPFFWAISRSQDATITMQNYSTRGLKGLLNYRYVLDQNSSGELDTAFLRDSTFGHSDRYTNYLSETSSVDRWFLRYRHYWVLPNDWIQRADINNVSDLSYPTDFPFETLNNGDPAVESRVSLTKNTEDQHFSIDNSYYINMLRGHPKGDNQDSVHRLPEINLTSKRKPIGETGFFYDYSLHYTYFARNDFAYDDLTKTSRGERQVTHTCATPNESPQWDTDPTCKPVRDGEFKAGEDLIRSGQRLTFEPSLSRPIQLGNFFNLTPKVSYRESRYNFGIQDVPNLTRRFLRSEVKLQTSFSRIFGDLENPYSNRFKHEFQPEIISTAVPWVDQPPHPFLGFNQSEDSEIPFFSREVITDTDLNENNGIQFDYEDRLVDRNLITYRITNKIIRKTWNADKMASYDRLLTWRLSQTYDAYEAQRSGHRQPWSDTESILNARLTYFNIYSKINYFPYQKFTNTSSNMTVNDDSGNYIKMGLITNYFPDKNGLITEDYLLQLGTTAKYVNLAGRVIYNGNDKSAAFHNARIKQLTYAIILRPPGNCWGLNFVQHFKFPNPDTIYQVRFEFLFDGKTSLQSPTSLVEAYGF